MRTASSFVAAFALFTLLSHWAVAQEPKTIVERAIAAHGGEAKIALLNRSHSKAEGTIDILPGQPPLPFSGEDWRMDGNSKMTITIRVQGVKVSLTSAVHDDTQWLQLFGQTQELTPQQATEIQESRHVDRIARLVFLADANVELSTLPETKVADRPASGVLVKSPGHKDVKLYFDKESNLLIKVEHAAFDLLSGKEVLEELVLSDYQDRDGLKYAMQSTVYRDGEKIMDGKVTLLEFVDKVDDKIFARP